MIKAAITFGVAHSRYGDCLVVVQKDHLIYFGFPAQDDDPLAILKAYGIDESLTRDNTYAQKWADRVMDGEAVPLAPQGTSFQRAVWTALQGIPAGETRTYADIASEIGRPRATRAVGTAIGRNPIACVIPCHRVVRTDGSLGGFRWGLPLKRRLLANEARTGQAA